MDALRKSVHIRSYFGPYSVRMRENNSEYVHFLRSDDTWAVSSKKVPKNTAVW